ncbi:divalent metal cation transporter [Rhodoblastus acidophilus]|uniref:Divalent metal cation transporter n=1 Tax=Candidatus Rhodoblastus alkanivorans TaxID=2954117 RepID=A0ABS9ZB49_9HYPH|nr:divalent metal cation transporter [Candidatus Rhodoblastus alkanivorans]MCI4677741.1 divalent metal cation transporter [Candidatus Rhodoblastus alkanivorans]MCI4684761.1 divalent metal cation transporter [Candidatus Rhodoblastus alkanivorans]MDI4642084.1 divalent metal cation transporter [Rhodoblastus acidophilus]
MADLSEVLPRRARLGKFLAVAGPGMVVMLADTDAGSVITAAQSGAAWGYRLLWLQFALIPVLYVVQELTVRLGLVTGQGHAELIEKHFGRFWAWFSVLTLIICCVGALLSEFAGLAGVGALMGLSAPVTMFLVASALLLMAYTHSYLTVERIALAVGAFELVFLVVAILARPDPAVVAAQVIDIPFRDPKYLYLVAANIGAVIMPWMVFFQQSAVVEKKLTVADIGAARADTFIGSIATQIIMAAVLVAAAATLGAAGKSGELDTVQQIAKAITPFLGEFAGRLLFGLGLAGAALVAAIVVTVTAARTLGEILKVNCSLDHSPRDAPWFYGAYTIVLIACALTVASGANLVSLSIGVQVMNALLLPTVLGFLYLLARRLPEPWRLQGGYAALCGAIVAIAAGFGVYSAFAGLFV